MATRDEMQVNKVQSGFSQPQTKVTHDKHVEDVAVNPTWSKECGVKSSCILSENLKHFHRWFSRYLTLLHLHQIFYTLHLLEGLVPFEVSLCFQKLIDQKYISLESLS